jgi:hypothetical protein
MSPHEYSREKEDDSSDREEIGRMMRENKEGAIQALRRAGATIEENPDNPDEVAITATKEQIRAAQNEKPPFLYHGSPTGGINVFEPRSAPERPDEPPLVYASPNLWVAEMSMLNGPRVGGGIYEDKMYVYIDEPREEYLQRDQTGHLYKFASDTFESNKGVGLGDQEWVSENPVVPMEAITYPSVLDKVIERGILVYFVTHQEAEQIKAVQEDPVHLKKVLGSLESENERRDRE